MRLELPAKSRMIALSLPGAGLKRPADLLQVERQAAVGRSKIAATIFGTSTPSEIRPQLQRTWTEPSARPAIAASAVAGWRFAIDVLRHHPGLSKALSDVLAVRDVDAEDDGRNARADALVFVDRSADDDAIHRVAQVFDRVVASPDPGAGKVWRLRRLEDRRGHRATWE